MTILKNVCKGNKMRTIQVDDELYEYLYDMSKKMNEQDNAATADPYVIQIEDVKTYPSPEGYGDRSLFYDGCETFYPLSAEGIRDMWEYYDKDIPESILKMMEDDSIDFFEVEYEIQKICGSYRIIEEQDVYVYKGAFFTWDGCRDHIEGNKHHYSRKARAFATNEWRNPEMSAVVKLLKSISKQGEINEATTPV